MLNSFSFKRKRVPNKKVKQLGKLDLCINVQIIRLLKINSRSSERRTANIHSREKEALIKKNYNISPPKSSLCDIRPEGNETDNPFDALPVVTRVGRIKLKQKKN